MAHLTVLTSRKYTPWGDTHHFQLALLFHLLNNTLKTHIILWKELLDASIPFENGRASAQKDLSISFGVNSEPFSISDNRCHGFSLGIEVEDFDETVIWVCLSCKRVISSQIKDKLKQRTFCLVSHLRWGVLRPWRLKTLVSENMFSNSVYNSIKGAVSVNPCLGTAINEAALNKR